MRGERSGEFCRFTFLLCCFFAISIALLPACGSVFYQPDRNLYFLPEKNGFKAREYALTAKDGTKIFAWYLPSSLDPKHPLGTVIQFHGNAENMSSHFTLVAWLTKAGYQVVTFDYRGYGKSDGEPNAEGTIEDGVAALDLAWKLHSEKTSETQPFVVLGQSLGGAIARRALDDFSHAREVTLLVLDSTFVSYKDVARRILASRWFTWPLSPLGMVLVSDRFSAEESNRRSTIPILVIHDRRDPTVPFAAAEEYYAETGATRKDIWILDQGRHIAGFSELNPGLRARFLDYLAARHSQL